MKNRNAAQTLSLLKKIVLRLIRSDMIDKANTCLRQKRKRGGWNDDLLMDMCDFYFYDIRL